MARIVKEINYKQVIEDNLSDEDIFSFYLGKFKIGQAFNSPLRQDNHPSAAIYATAAGRLRYKDYGSGENYSATDFVRELYRLTYPQTLNKIISDFSLVSTFPKNNTQKIEKRAKNIYIEPKKHKIIQIIPRQWELEDFEYWSSYGINSLTTLQTYNVYPIERAWINKRSITIQDKELCYAYYFKPSNHLKLYFPLREKGRKWWSNTDNFTDIQGYYQCDIKKNKPKLLILSKSLKECMFFRERGIDSMAINAEGHKFNEDFIRHIRKYCSVIRTLYDIDKTGLKEMEYLKEKFGFEPIIMPEFQCNENRVIKDPTDAYRYCQREEVELFINQIKEGKL